MILAIDTATRWAGLALYDGTAILAESGWLCLNTHTIELTPAIGAMLQRAGASPADLKGIAVAIGPGSYTGLRVGLALAKGLALANQVPLVGVPTLDIVAASFGPLKGQLVVAAAAGRERIVAAIYQWKRRQWAAEDDPVVETWDELLSGLDESTIIFTGEITPEAAKMIRAASKTYRVASPAASARRAGHLAELGWRRLQKGLADDARNLAPIYLLNPAGA